ncbi:hypothetical protein N9K54_05450 [Candidatus Poseidonia alphae]|nr:hypothetical protein [Candidatus Poseidonia alphae]
MQPPNSDEDDQQPNDEAPQEYPLTDAGEAFYLTGVTRTTSGTNSGVITGSWFRTAIAIYVVQNRLHENGGSFTRQDFQQHIVDSGVLTDEDTAQRGATAGTGSAGHRWKHREQGANQYIRSPGFLTTDGDGNYTVFSGNEQRWRDLAEGYVVLPELDDEEESGEQQTQQEDSEEQAQQQTDADWTVTYPASTLTANVPEGLEFAPSPPSSGSSSSSNSVSSSSTEVPTPGIVYVLVRTVGPNRVLHHLVKIGEVHSQNEFSSLDVEQERQQGGSISNREHRYQANTEAVLQDTQGRFIHSEMVAVVPCTDHRRYHEVTGIGGALNDAGFERVTNVSQQEYYRLFDPEELSESEGDLRRENLSQALEVIQQYVNEQEECLDVHIFTERLEAIGLALEN